MENGARKNPLPFGTVPEIFINGDWHLGLGTVKCSTECHSVIKIGLVMNFSNLPT